MTVGDPANPASEAPDRRTADDCTLVLIGALGDLARRKLYPALYRLALDNLLAPNFTLVGVDRMPDDDAGYAAAIGTDDETFVWEDRVLQFRLEGDMRGRPDRLLQLMLPWKVSRSPLHLTREH